MKKRVAPAILAAVAALAIALACLSPASAADPVAQAIADLGNKERGGSRQASEVLLDQGRKAIPQLIGALDDPDIEKKTAVVIILGKLKATEAVPRLIAELKNEDVSVRIMTAFSLGFVGDSRALPHLTAMLGSATDDMTRQATLIALGHLRNKEAIPQVKAALADPDQSTRVLAATALGALGNHEGLDEALNGTKSDNQSLALISIQALGMIGDTRALPRLEEMTKASEAWSSDILLAKKQIAYTNVAPGKRVEVLRGHLDDPGRHVGEWAVTALADLGTPEAISLLQEKAQAVGSRTGSLAQRKLKMLGKQD